MSGTGALDTAQRVGALRVKARLSQRGLAELAGVSSAYVGLLERGGIRNPGVDNLERIAGALGWPDYHTMLVSAELTPPRPDTEREALERDRRMWEARLDAQLAELRGLFLEARADYAAMLRIVQAVVDRAGRAGGPAPTSRP